MLDTSWQDFALSIPVSYTHLAVYKRQDMGRLYINYPMIESYQHLKHLPDPEYAERKIPVSLQPGWKYKALVSKETCIKTLIELPHRIDDLLHKHLGVYNEEMRKRCCDTILSISGEDDLNNQLPAILQEVMDADRVQTTKYGTD